MNEPQTVFIDANIFVYFLDESAEWHESTVQTLQKLVDHQAELYTSHHVIEEVLYIVSRLAVDKKSVTIAAKQIADLPGLRLVEPETSFVFTDRYVQLWIQAKLGINDALLLQLIIDAHIEHLFSQDKTFLSHAQKCGIKLITSDRI